ncbi:MAG: hypothetical protein HY258_03825 [Chloroflexi bacterium]|nr:hypothetical protein [Chloroflexota bacterium]
MARKPPRRYKQEQPSNDWLDRLAHFNLHFGRFLRDAFGVVLIALALMSLLARWGVTGGILLTPWAQFISTWFGWGSYLIVFAIGYGGFALIRRDGGRLSWGRLLSLELASLLTLGLLSIFGGNSLVSADAGQYGGRLGWGLAYLLSRYIGLAWSGVILFMLTLLAAVTGFGLWSWIEVWLYKLAGETPMAPHPAIVQKEAEPVSAEEASAKSASKKKANAIPPEFRTSLKSSDKKSEKPARPILREEGLPPLNLLLTEQLVRADERTINQTAGMIMKTLSEFGIPATVIGYRVGPAVTQFAVQPGFIKKPGTTEDDACKRI